MYLGHSNCLGEYSFHQSNQNKHLKLKPIEKLVERYMHRTNPFYLFYSGPPLTLASRRCRFRARLGATTGLLMTAWATAEIHRRSLFGCIVHVTPNIKQSKNKHKPRNSKQNPAKCRSIGLTNVSHNKNSKCTKQKFCRDCTPITLEEINQNQRSKECSSCIGRDTVHLFT